MNAGIDRREFIGMTAGLVAAAATGRVLAQAPDGAIGGLEAKFMDVNGIRTRYYEYGSGEPLLLVHGSRPAGTSSANTWAPVIRGLAQRYHVVAPDRRGHGMTDEPTADYSPHSEVAHLHDFLRAMKFDRITAIGQSTGAYHVARIAMEKPATVKALVVVDSATLSPPVGNLGERRAELFKDRPQSTGERFRYDMRQLSFNKEHVTDEFVAAAAWMADQPGGRKTDAAMHGQVAARYEEQIRQGAEEIRNWMKSGQYQIPTLLYWGKNDPSALLATGLALFDMVSEQNRRTRMLIVNKAGHFHFREYPDEWVGNFVAHPTICYETRRPRHRDVKSFPASAPAADC